MGGDGGSIPTRADMVKTKGYVSATTQGSMGFAPNSFVHVSEETVDNQTSRQLKTTTCALTNEPLANPIVACRAGYMYNKEPLLKALLGKSIPVHFSHISSLKDLINVRDVPTTCPVTKKDLSFVKCVLMVPCGCIVSEKVVSDTGGKVTNANAQCIVCLKPVERLIKLHPSKQELEAQLAYARECSAHRHKTKSGGAEKQQRNELGVKRYRADKPTDETSSNVFKSIFHK